MLLHAARDGQLKADNPTTMDTAVLVTIVKFILQTVHFWQIEASHLISGALISIYWKLLCVF